MLCRCSVALPLPDGRSRALQLTRRYQRHQVHRTDVRAAYTLQPRYPQRPCAYVLLSLLDEYAVGEPAYEMAVKGNLLCLLAELFRNELADDLTKNSGGRSGVSPALRYIAEHYAEDIALDDLASLCCMNRSYFCRRFRDVTGKTAIGYLNEYRLTKARALLMSTDRSVTDIARDAGFSDSSYFARLFMRCYGVSPREMRSDGTGI